VKTERERPWRGPVVVVVAMEAEEERGEWRVDDENESVENNIEGEVKGRRANEREKEGKKEREIGREMGLVRA